MKTPVFVDREYQNQLLSMKSWVLVDRNAKQPGFYVEPLFPDRKTVTPFFKHSMGDGMDIQMKSSRRTFRELTLREESVWYSI